ncbi:MAG TPA: histidine kinase [Spirochaetia bacterium]|nr:histidine kinase [Spirochaetia bacterium]
METNVSFSLRYKLLLYSITLILLPVLLIGSLAHFESVSSVRQNIIRSRLESMQLAAATMDYIFRDVQAVSLFFLQDDNLRRLLASPRTAETRPLRFRELTQINQYIWFLLGSKNYIDSVYIRGFNGVVLDPDTTNYEITRTMEEEVRAWKGRYVWYSDQVVSKYRRTAIPVFSNIRLMNDIDDITRPLGFLVINVSESMISRIYEDKGVTPGARFYLIDSSGTIRSAADKGLLGRPLASIYGRVSVPGGIARSASVDFDAPASAATHLFHDRRFVYLQWPLESTGLALVSVVPRGELTGSLSGFEAVILLGICLSLLLSGLFAVIFSRRTLANIRRLSDAVRAIGKGNFSVELDLRGNDEIALLGTSVGSMSRTIAGLIKENYEIGIKEKEAELMALEAQISPHFLYNVLDTIYWKCRLEKAYTSAELLKALSDLFRLNLNRGERFIALRRELEYLRSYLLIQKEKYADRIEIGFEVDGGISEKPVLKQVLQPIVENAIIHGFAGGERRGHVLVRAFPDGTDIVLEVSDDGRGIDPAKIDEYLRRGPSNGSIGLKNVDERLRLNFGDAYRIRIEANPGGGTRVLIRQPLDGKA